MAVLGQVVLGHGVKRGYPEEHCIESLPLTQERRLTFLGLHFPISFIESPVENLSPIFCIFFHYQLVPL